MRFSFSIFSVFLAIYHVLKCAFVIFQCFLVFLFSHIPCSQVCVSHFPCFSDFLTTYHLLKCALLIFHVFQCFFFPCSMFHSVCFSFSMFCSVSLLILCSTVWVSNFLCFSVFLAIYHLLECALLIIHVFQRFLPYTMFSSVCFSFSMFFQIFWPYTMFYSVHCLFSTFFSVSCPVPWFTVYISHFLCFSIFLAIYHVLQRLFLIFHVYHSFWPDRKSVV